MYPSDGEEAPRPMGDMVEFIARSIVSAPDEVEVTEEERGNRVIITLRVDEADKGKVIGRGGRVAESIRALLRVAAVKNQTRVVLEIE